MSVPNEDWGRCRDGWFGELTLGGRRLRVKRIELAWNTNYVA